MRLDGWLLFYPFALDTSHEEVHTVKENQLTQTLQQVAREKVPDSLDLWPVIEAQLRPRPRFRWMWLVPNTRLGWAFLSLALILAFGAVAYAVSPAVARLFEQEAGLDPIPFK